MPDRWSAGTFLAKAREIRRRLGHWHVERYRHPVQFANERTYWERQAETFGHLVGGASVERPESLRIPPMFDWVDPEEDSPGEGDGLEAYAVPDRDTNRPVALWLLREFGRHLDAAPSQPQAIDYLKEAFAQILALPAWAVYAPRDEEEASWLPPPLDERDPPACYVVAGLQVSAERLDTLVDAAERLLAAVPPAWGVAPQDLESSHEHQGHFVESTAPPPAEGGGKVTEPDERTGQGPAPPHGRARGRGKAAPMPAAAKDTSGAGGAAELPGPEPYPVLIAGVAPEVAELLRAATQPQEAGNPPDVIWYHGDQSYSADRLTPVATRAATPPSIIRPGGPTLDHAEAARRRASPPRALSRSGPWARAYFAARYRPRNSSRTPRPRQNRPQGMPTVTSQRAAR